MAEDEKGPEKLEVRLNEAFERMENQQQRSRDIKPRGRTGFSNILSVLLALIAIGMASYAGYVVQIKLPEQSASAARATTRIDSFEQQMNERFVQLNDLNARLDTLSAKLADIDSVNQEAMDAFKAQVDESVAEIRRAMGASSEDWLFAEAEYLLRLGNQRVVMEKDAKGALALFAAADEIVRTTEGVAAFGLRQAIANDMAALQAVKEVDVDGIFVRLSALAAEVERLRQKQQAFKPREVAPAPENPDAGFGERAAAFLGRVGERMASLVDYRRDGERITPILPPEEEYYLRQNLVLKMQTAQMGLLRGDQAIYAGSLGEAQSWVERYFDVDDPATTAMLNTLAELGRIDIETDLPDVSGSLREVRKLLSRFHQAAERTQAP